MDGRLVIKTHKLNLIIILLLMTRVGFLLPDVSLISSITTSDMAFVWGFLWGLYVLLSFRGQVRYGRMGGIVAIGMLLTITSSITCNVVFGQSFFLGLRAQRYFLICLFLYYPITALLKLGYLDWEDIKSSIRTVAIIQLSLYYLQYLLAGRITFLNISITSRNGLPRLYGDCSLINIAYLIAVNDLVGKDSEERSSKKTVIFIIAVLLYYTFVRQGRMITFAALACLYIGILISKQRSTRKIVMMIAGGILVLILLQTPLLQSFTSALSDTSSDQNTLIRINAQEFYISALEDHKIFGLGFVNSTYAPAFNASGALNSYLFVDNGIYGFAYQYGGIGLLWVALIVLSGIVFTIRNMKNKDYFVLLFLLRWAITYATNIEFYHQYYTMTLVFVLIYMGIMQDDDYCEELGMLDEEVID